MTQKFCQLGDVATYVNGYAFKPADWGSEGLPIIRIQDLTGNSYQANYFSGEIDNRFRVYSGDILISWSASLGVFEWQGGDAVLNQHIFKVVFNKMDIDNSYGYRYCYYGLFTFHPSFLGLTPPCTVAT